MTEIINTPSSRDPFQLELYEAVKNYKSRNKELQGDENENFVPFNKELNARMSKISSKYTDKIEEGNNSLSHVTGVQENYRRNIEEDEEERDSFINAFLDQSAGDENKDSPYSVRYKEKQRSNISNSKRNGHYSTQIHKSKSAIMKSPKNTLTIKDTSNVMEKFNKYNETQKNKSNIRNSLNLDTSFNSSLDYDIGNNLSQNNKINSDRRSPRLEEKFQNDYRNPNLGRNTKEHFASDNKEVRKDLIETGKKITAVKTDENNKKVNEHVNKDISELKKERMRLIRNQKERESSIKDTSNQNDEEGSVLEKFNKYREAQKNLKSKEDIERYAVPVNIQNTNEVDLQHSKSSERKSLHVKDSVDSEINDMFDNSKRSRMTLEIPNMEVLQNNRAALRTREGILRQNAEDTTRLNDDRDRLRKESQNSVSVPSKDPTNSSRLKEKEVNEENFEDYVKKQEKKLSDINESVKKVPKNKELSSSFSRVKLQSNESLSKSQERLDQEIEKLYNDKRLSKASDDRFDKSLKNIERERPRINDFQNITDEIFDEEEMRKKASKSRQNILQKDIVLSNNKHINRHQNKTRGRTEGSPHQREKSFDNTKVDKNAEGNINKHKEKDSKIAIRDSSRIEDRKKDGQKMIGHDNKLNTVHADQIKSHKTDENKVFRKERIKGSSTPRNSSFNTREVKGIVPSREHSGYDEDKKPYDEMESFSQSSDKQYKESKKNKHHDDNSKHDENEDIIYYAEKENHRRNYNRGFINDVRDHSINGSSVSRSRQLDSKNIEATKTKNLDNEDENIKNYDRHSDDKMTRRSKINKLQIELDEDEINLDQSADRRNTLDDLFAAEDYKKIKGKKDISLTPNTSRETLSSIQEQEQRSARKSQLKTPEEIFEKKGKYLEDEDTEGENRRNRTTSKNKMLHSDFDDNTETPKRRSSRERPVPVKVKSHDNDHMTPKIKISNSATKLKRESSFTSDKSTKKMGPLKATTSLKYVSKTPDPKSNNKENRKMNETFLASSKRKSLSFTNISNIQPSSPRSQGSQENLNSVTLREQIYFDWLQKKDALNKATIKQKLAATKKMEEEKEMNMKERKVIAKKTFDSWYETKSEKLSEKQKTTKVKRKKELQELEEKEQRKKDAKKFFQSWKEKKDEELKEKHQKKREELREKKNKVNEEKKEKTEVAKKTFENWKAKKDEQLEKEKQKRAEERSKKVDEEYEKQERKQSAQRVFEKWKENKGSRPSSARSTTPALTQRPWCPNSRNSADVIPKKVGPVIQRNAPNRARTLSASGRLQNYR